MGRSGARADVHHATHRIELESSKPLFVMESDQGDSPSRINNFVLGRHPHRLYMLPTTPGLYFALLLLVMLLVAVNYNNGLAYGFTFTLAAIGLVSMLYTHRNVVGTRVTVCDAPPVFAGEVARFPVTLENPSAQRRFGLWLLSGSWQRRSDLAPQGRQEVHLAVHADRRGYLPCPDFSVSSAYPFGLLYTWSKPMRTRGRCLVYPAPGARLPWPQEPLTEGWHQPGRSPEGDDFTGLREYQLTDPPRHVHWKAAARGGAPLTKRFGDSSSGAIWLHWNATEGARCEERLGVLCRWALDAERDGIRYGLRLPTVEIPPDLGPRHLHICLRALALWEMRDA